MLNRALSNKGVNIQDIDTLIITHWHHDHFGNAGMFPGVELLVGEKELEFGRQLYGESEVRAKTGMMGRITVISDTYRVCEGITVIRTPGHSPGSISVIVEQGSERIAITGDTIMTREQFETRKFSHWYTDEQKQEVNRSMDIILDFAPVKIIPGHDRAFYISRER